MASIAQFLGNPAMREPYDQLAEIVRTGRTVAWRRHRGAGESRLGAIC